MKRWIDAFRVSLSSRLFIALAVISGLYIVCGYVVAGMNDWPVSIHTQLYSNAMRWGTIWFVLGLVSFRCFYIMIAVRPRQLTRTILDDLGRNYFSPEKMASGIPVVLLFAFLFSVFTSFKSMIPEMVPFQYDALFAHIDRIIHFGHDPWRILFPVLGTAIMTTAISFVYKTWFVAKFCVLYWQAFSTARPRLREQFFLTYMLSWIVNGTIFATLLSSAGPCFYGHVVTDGPNPYAELMTFLHDTNKISPVWDLFAQDYLWNAHSDTAITFFSGISAMPSMHVALAFLFALVAWGSGRKAGIFFTVYLVLIMVGSVHLGWHYAIDGYFGIISTAILWYAVGAVLKWADGRAMARRGEALPQSSS